MTETAVGSGVLNRPAARFVAIGLLIVIFGAFAVIFVINGVQLFRSAARLPLPRARSRNAAVARCGWGSASPSRAKAWSSPSSGASTCCGSNERSWQRWTNRFTQSARQANSGREPERTGSRGVRSAENRSLPA